jgi:hypothetical protein
MTIKSIKDLKQDSKNANKGSKRGAKAIAQSLGECGAGRSIVCDRNGVVIGGNQVLKAASKIGLPIETIHSDGHKLIVVVRDDLDMETQPEEARRLALFDNRAQELSLDWDAEVIKELQSEGISLEGLWTDEELLKKIMQQELNPPEGLPEDNKDIDESLLAGKSKMKCPDCGYEF